MQFYLSSAAPQSNDWEEDHTVPFRGKKPEFFVCSAATGAALTDCHYDPVRGWVYTVANDYGEGFFVAFSTAATDMRLHYTTFTRQSIRLPMLPITQMYTNHLDFTTMNATTDHQLLMVDLVERVRFKLRHGLRAHVTVPGTSDISRQSRFSPITITKHSWKSFSQQVEKLNSGLQFMTNAAGIVRVEYPWELRHLCQAQNQQMAPLVAILADFYGPHLTRQAFHDFLLCCASNNFPAPEPDTALRSYHHHHQPCRPTGAIKTYRCFGRDEDRHDHSPRTLQAALKTIRLLPQIRPPTDLPLNIFKPSPPRFDLMSPEEFRAPDLNDIEWITTATTTTANNDPVVVAEAEPTKKKRSNRRRKNRKSLVSDETVPSPTGQTPTYQPPADLTWSLSQSPSPKKQCQAKHRPWYPLSLPKPVRIQHQDLPAAPAGFTWALQEISACSTPMASRRSRSPRPNRHPSGGVEKGHDTVDLASPSSTAVNATYETPSPPGGHNRRSSGHYSTMSSPSYSVPTSAGDTPPLARSIVIYDNIYDSPVHPAAPANEAATPPDQRPPMPPLELPTRQRSAAPMHSPHWQSIMHAGLHRNIFTAGGPLRKRPKCWKKLVF